MCGVYFRSIQLVSVKCVLVSYVQIVGGFEDGHLRVAALQMQPMADVRHGIPQTLCTCGLFFNLEGTLAVFRVHPHFSSYPFVAQLLVYHIDQFSKFFPHPKAKWSQPHKA